MPNKAYDKIMSGQSDNNIKFSDIVYTLETEGFSHRIKGDHHVFTRAGISEIINVQPIGNKAKTYQVRQIRDIFRKYNI